MRQPGGARERGPALVVDEHEDQRLRRVAQRQRGHQRLQEFALASACRARDQHVRPVSGDVEGERRPVRGPSERNPGGPPAAPPQLGDSRGVRPPHPPQIKQPNGPACPRLPFIRPVPDGRQRAGRLVGPLLADQVQPGHVDRAAGLALPVDASAAARRVGVQPAAAHAGQVPPVIVAADHEHAGGRAVRQHLVDARHIADPGRAVDDEHHDGQWPLTAAVAARGARGASAAARVGGRGVPPGHQVAQLADPLRPRRRLGADAQPAGRAAERAKVRQPAGPAPGGGFLRQQHEPKVARAVQHGELAHRPGERRAARRRRPGDAEHAEVGEGDGDRHVADHRRGVSRRAVRATGSAAAQADRAGQQVSGAGPKAQEVLVVRRALPQPGARARGDQRGAGRIGQRLPARPFLGRDGVTEPGLPRGRGVLGLAFRPAGVPGGRPPVDQLRHQRAGHAAQPEQQEQPLVGERPDDGPGGERQHGRDEQDQPGRPAALRFDAAAGGVDDDRRGQRGHRPERLVDQPAERVRRVGAQRDPVARPRVPARAARGAGGTGAPGPAGAGPPKPSLAPARMPLDASGIAGSSCAPSSQRPGSPPCQPPEAPGSPRSERRATLRSPTRCWGSAEIRQSNSAG